MGVLRVCLIWLTLAVPIAVIGADIELMTGEEHTFQMGGIVLTGDITYHWSVGGEEAESDSASITLSWDEPGDYTVEAQYEINGCMSPMAAVSVTIIDGPPPIIPDKFFTPNGDGVNDFWHIKNINYYPDAQIEIFDRYSKCLLRISGLQFIENNGWDGNYNGHQMPSTDYWYYIRNILPNKPMSGHFTLKRGKL